MIKVFKKPLILILTAILLLSCFCFSACAESSTSVTASKTTVNIGEKVTVTVKYTTDGVIGAIEGNLQYNSNIFEYVSTSLDANSVNVQVGNIKIIKEEDGSAKTVSYTFTFRAKAMGSSNISLVGPKYSTSDYQDYFIDKNTSTTVNVADTTNPTKSGNANLKSLYLSDNIALTPAFNKDVTTYNVNIDNSITKVLVSAITEDANAKTSVQGDANMKVGANQRIVIVTAPNGTQKKYVININRAAPDGTTPEVNPYDVTINGEKWILASEYPEGTILGRFVLSSTIVNSIEVPAIINEVNGKVVLMAQNADGSVTKYFEYSSSTEEFKEYRILNEASQNYVLLNFEPNIVTPKGYYKTTAVIGGHSVEVFKYENPDYADYLIFYAEYNSETKDYFRYDSTTGSVQRSPEFNSDLKDAKILASSKFASRLAALTVKERIFVGAVFVSGLLILALIIIMIVKIAKSASQNRLARLDELDELEELEEYDYYEPEQDDFELLEETEENEEE